MKVSIITSDNNKQDKIKKTLVLIVFLYMIIGFILVSKYDLNGFIIIIPELTLILILIFIPAFIKRYRLLGELKTGKKSFQTVIKDKKEKIELKDKDSLTLYYRGAKGDSFPFANLGVGFFGFMDGAGNVLKYKSLGKEKQFEILIESSSVILFIKRWFRELVNEGIDCKIVKKDVKDIMMKADRKKAFEYKVNRFKNN